MADNDQLPIRKTKYFTPVFLSAADVPNSDLPDPVLVKNLNKDLRRYLTQRDFPQGGNKEELVQRYVLV